MNVNTSVPRRARLILDFDDGETRTHSADEGWAALDGAWVLWCSDVDEPVWQSWPAHAVVCVEWRPTPAGVEPPPFPS